MRGYWAAEEEVALVAGTVTWKLQRITIVLRVSAHPSCIRRGFSDISGRKYVPWNVHA